MIWLAIGLAGGLGASLRYVIDRSVGGLLSASRFPWGIWLVNVTGSLGAGVVAGLASSGVVGPEIRAVVAGGFLGGYTTFSTAMLQVFAATANREVVVAALNLLGTLVVSVMAALAGFALAS